MRSFISNAPVANLSQIDSQVLQIEKKNIINILKLVVKDLIDISLKNNRYVDKQSEHLIYFYDVFENVLNHGFKGKKGFGLGIIRNKDFTVLLDLISSKSDYSACLSSIRDITEIKTSLGRIRAWMRMSLMQKKLAENFQNLIQEKEILNEFYESESILLSDESNIISGLLVGLNALDISIDLRSEALLLDQPIRPISYSLYLREKLPDSEESEIIDTVDEQRINEIFDQKNFVEELNKKLEIKNEELSLKLQSLEKTNGSLSEKISKIKIDNVELKAEIDLLNDQIKKIQDECKIKIDSVYQDVQAERDTFSLSKNSLDQMFIDLQKKFYEEQKNKSDLETELKTTSIIKDEQQIALRLLETELKDKNDLVKLLREQLEQVKAINLDLVNDAKKNENNYKKQDLLVHELREKLSTFTIEIEDTKKKLEQNEKELRKKEEICKFRLEQIDSYQKKLTELESNYVIEKNWRLELQNDISVLEENLNQANGKVEQLEETEKKLIKSEEENQISMKKIHELELTLEEMGSKLGMSHLKIQDFKDVTKQMHGFQWESDEKVTMCKICTKEFNVARRRHHCRRCGRIFCNECSDNKMPLPSWPKPVRVCNTCFDQILQNNDIK